jgi:hypothetical protein
VPDGCGLALWEEVGDGDGELDATCVVTWDGVGESAKPTDSELNWRSARR